MDRASNSDSAARTGGSAVEESPQAVYALNAWEIDLARRELRYRHSPVPIGNRAFDILGLLVRSNGAVVTKYQLVDRVWPDTAVSDNAIQYHIFAIRRLLGEDRHLVKTVSGRGYRLVGTWTAGPAAKPEPRVEPPERTRSQVFRTNLPIAGSALIGRNAQRQKLLDLLSAYRVVTLTGAGGIGKTVLARDVARCLFPTFGGDCWLVELASLQEPSLVGTAVAGALGFSVGNETMVAEAIARAIGERRLLLVLDNCEHLVGAAAQLTSILVRGCPNISLLVTSRESLRIEGECVYGVPPLEVPPERPEPASEVAQYSAVQLFMARMLAAGSEFAAQQHDLPTIAAICRRLDGIPLAIEFAASHAASLGLRQIAEGLDDRFRLLTVGRRTALPRHRTLRAALNWSYELLAEPERRLLCRLAIFAGGFTLEAAAAVMGETGKSVVSVANGIASLVEKSLVALDGSVPSGRWRLLETIRAYALEQLAGGGEAADTASRHAAYYRDLFAAMVPGRRLQPSAGGMSSDLREIDNVRAALDWCFSRGDAAAGVALTAAYAPVWLNLSLMVECRDRAERALGTLRPDMNIDPPLRLQLYLVHGVTLLYTMAPAERREAILAGALELAVSLGDLDAELRGLWALWNSHMTIGKCLAAHAVAVRFSEVAARGGHPGDRLVGDRLTAQALLYHGDPRQAQRVLEGRAGHGGGPATQRQWMLFQNDPEAMALICLTQALWLQGLMDQAAEKARAALAAAHAADRPSTIFWVLRLAVYPVAFLTGDFAAAGRAVAMLHDATRDLSGVFFSSSVRCLEAILLVEQGDFQAGLGMLRAGTEAFEKSGQPAGHPEYTVGLVQALCGLGQVSEALATVECALAGWEQSEERWYLAELLRSKGEALLLRASGRSITAAEDCFLAALELARAQGALFWELRSALSLARLRISQHRPDEARRLLAPIYAQFTEGFDTADLRTARAILV